MKKRLLASLLMGIMVLTSVHTEAYALADTYNADNYIVDKVEQYGGSHLVITNSGVSGSQTVGTWPVESDAVSTIATVNGDDSVPEADENVYGYDKLGQQLLDPSTILQEVGEDLSSGSSQIQGSVGNAVSTVYKVGDTRTMYLKNQNNDGTYPTTCVCVVVGEHCTIWIPADDPYYLACMEAVAETSVVPGTQEPADETVAEVKDNMEDTVSQNTVSGNTVSENGVSDNTVFENMVSQNTSVPEEPSSDGVISENVIYTNETTDTENAMVAVMEILADEFDEKYGSMVNMFGDTAAADASNRGDADGKTAIICYDIFGDFSYGSAGGYVAGYFWGADLKGYGNSTGNAMDCIHVDSYQGMGRARDYSIQPNNVENCYSTLVHEYQHMIHYSHLTKKGLHPNSTPTYMNETFSAAAEYLMYGHNAVRTSYYNAFDDFRDGMSLTQWDTNGSNWAHGTLMNYSVAYMFSQYIRTQYKGVVDETGSTIYKDAMNALSSDNDLLTVIAGKIGTTTEDIWLNFRTALELKNATGPYGFGGESDFTYYINPKIYTGSMSNLTLAPGGSVVVPIDGPHMPPEDAGTRLKYLGIDLDKREEDIAIAFVAEDGNVIDVFQGTMELKANVSPYYLSQDVTFSIEAGEEYAKLEGNILTAQANGVVTVRATWNEKDSVFTEYDITIDGQEDSPFSVTELTSGKTKGFKNLNDAVKNLDKVAGEATGTYVFAFGSDSVLTADVDLPSYVTEAVFVTDVYTAEEMPEGQSDEQAGEALGEQIAEQAEEPRLFVELNLNGYQIHTSNQLVLEEGIVFVNSSEEKEAFINVTKSNAAAWNTPAGLVLKPAEDDVSFVDTDGQPVSQQERAIWMDNVDITASKTAVELHHVSDNSIPYVLHSDMTVHTLRMTENADALQEESAGMWSLEGKVTAEIIDMQEDGTTTLSVLEAAVSTGVKVGSGDILYAGNVSKVKDLHILPGAVLLTDTFLQISGGKAYLWAGAEWIINDSAVIYNPVLSAADEGDNHKVAIYKNVDAQIDINGEVKRNAENIKLSFAQISGRAENANDMVLQDYVGQTKLFDTSIASFPLDMIGIEQANADSLSEYNMVYQDGNSVYVGKKGIVVKEVEDNQETILGAFVKWSDAVSYLNSSADSSKGYVVEFSESQDISGALTLSKKINDITFRGAGAQDARVVLVYSGDAKLNCNATIENMTLAAKSLTATNTLSLQSATIDCVNKIALKNVVTKDPYNVLSYGGNTSKNGLTISGTVTASDETGMSDENIVIKRTDDNGDICIDAVARKNAISLQVKSMEATGYTRGVLLCNAEKAGAGWFVVGSVWENTNGAVLRTVSFGTHKKGKAIHCGEITENVKLYSANSENSNYVYESGFVSLQDALTEIDRLAIKTAYYRIELVSADENVVTFNNKAPKFPAKTAGLTIAADKENELPNFYFSGNLILKSDITFEDIVFVPQKKCTVSIGNYTLHVRRCMVDTSRASAGIAGITGSNVNGSSALVLDDTALHINGNVSKVGSLVFTGEETEEISMFSLKKGTPAYPVLVADGSVNIGKIELFKDGYLTGLASVTRKNGKVTKLASKITIGKNVYSKNGNTLYLDLREKKAKEFVDIVFDSSEMSDICQNGILFAKAAGVTYPNIKAAQRNEGNCLIKAGSYLAYFEDGFGTMLSFTEADGARVEIPCRTFADAVTEMNNQKTKRDYTITLFDKITEFSGADGSGKVTPKALTMPNKKYVDTLTIQADRDVSNKDVIKLGFIKNITLTSNLVLKDVNFVQLLKSGAVYRTADFVKDGYPAAVTLNAAGYGIVLEGDNTFNTPLIVNGAGKSVLTFGENGTITTKTNDYEENHETLVKENVIYGMITGCKEVTVEDCNLVLQAYKTSRTATKYSESKNKITTLNLHGALVQDEGFEETSGNVSVLSAANKAELTCTNVNNHDGKLFVEGKVSLKNVVLEGDMAPVIHADGAFTITGKLTSGSDYAVLETRLKGKGKEPYLNVSGKVLRDEGIGPVTVAVYPEVTAVNPHKPVNLKQSGKDSIQLLTAKNALTRDFKPMEDNYSGGEFRAEEPINSSGYFMKKSNGKIYVCNGEPVKLAVYEGDYAEAGESELLGYYESFKTATTEVDAIKNKAQKYTFVLISQNGTATAPVSMVLPSQAESIVVTRLADSTGNEKIYFSGNISLKCDTVMQNIEFAPVKKGKGTAFSFSIAGYDLWLKDITISDESDKMTLKNITGNGKPTVVLDSEDLEISGKITKVAKIEVLKEAKVNGEYLTKTEE